ncbi:MAG: hypothetical protein AAB466_09475 [Verrucomicrobiota bacterium]
MEWLAVGATDHGWWKEGAEGPTMNATMISNGLTVDNPANNGGRIALRLSGRGRVNVHSDRMKQPRPQSVYLRIT